MLETSDDLLDKSKLVRPAAKPRVTKGKIQIDTDWYIYRIFELLEKISSPFGLVVQRLTRISLRNEKILGSIPRMGTFFCQINRTTVSLVTSTHLLFSQSSRP